MARAQPLTGAVVERTVVLRAVTAGGSVTTDPDAAPAVITAQTRPRDAAVGVPVTVFPQVVFSEPVRQVPGQVTLTDDTGTAVPITLLGTGLSGLIADLQDASAVVTALTVQPRTGLRYGTRYTLTLGAGIVDLDSPTPKALTPYATRFTTFGPEAIGGTDEPLGTGGLVILDDRAYVAASVPGVGTGRTQVRVYDVSDPVTPQEIVPETPVGFQGQPATISGAAQEDGTRVLAVGTARYTSPSGPSNVHLVDVTTDTPSWVGAVTVGRDPLDGLVRRTAIVGDQIYALVSGMGKGLLVLDQATMRANVAAARAQGEQAAPYFTMLQQLGLEGQAFGQDAIAATIFLDTDQGAHSLQADLAVVTMPVDGTPVPVAVTTGRRALAVVSPTTTEVLSSGPIRSLSDEVVLSAGWVTAAGIVDGRPLAVVVGPAGASARLVVVDLTTPRNPRALGWLALPAGTATRPGSLLLRDGVVYLGGATDTTIVTLTDPTAPRIVGTVAGGGFVAVSDANLLFSSGHFFDGARGLQAAAVGKVLILSAPDTVIPYDDHRRTLVTVGLRYRVVGAETPPTTLRVDVLRDQTRVQALAAPFDGAQGDTTWPAGAVVTVPATYTAQATIDEGLASEFASARVRLRVSDLRAEWELQRKAFVAAVAAGQHRIANTYDGTGSGLEPPINRYDFATATRAFVKTIADDDGRPPQFPNDVLVLTVQGEGLAFQGAGAQVRLPVPADGRVEATLVATSALPALQLRQLTITADYYPDADRPEHRRLQADTVVIVHERLRGLILNALAGVIGRGEGLTARGSELLVGMVPLAGDAVGLLTEAINALDPTTEVSTLNASLAVVGMATEFTQVTGPAGPIDPCPIGPIDRSHRSLDTRRPQA